MNYEINKANASSSHYERSSEDRRKKIPVFDIFIYINVNICRYR